MQYDTSPTVTESHNVLSRKVVSADQASDHAEAPKSKIINSNYKKVTDVIATACSAPLAAKVSLKDFDEPVKTGVECSLHETLKYHVPEQVNH
jgi:uncharacterized membrane protein